MKKLIGLGVVIFLLMSFSANAAGLSDIEGHKNQLAIQYLYDTGVIAGYSDGTFQPDRTVNRAELLKILVAGNNMAPDSSKYINCFPDVKEEWFAPYICAAKERGWIDGYDDGTFKPEQTVNKVEAITMLVSIKEYILTLDLRESVFIDVDKSAWYAPYVRAAHNNNILANEGGVYGVGDDMTRGEISENIYQSILRDKNKSNTEYGIVTNVVDGDTIDVDVVGEIMRIRLIGIDTPETVHPTKEVECFGPEASQIVEDELLGKYVYLQPDNTQEDVDSYGRYLRYVTVADGIGTDFNHWLVEEGYAYEYTYDEDYIRKDRFVEAQAYAEENENGLWAEGVCEEIVVEGDYVCSSNSYNCDDFSAPSEAQVVFDYCMAEVGSDVHRLDGDENGLACEDL